MGGEWEVDMFFNVIYPHCIPTVKRNVSPFSRVFPSMSDEEEGVGQ